MKRLPCPRVGTSVNLEDPALVFLQVLWRVEHALERVSKRMEDTIGISGPQRFAVRVIGAFPDIGAAELARVLHLHPSTLSGVIRRLELRGLVRRVRHAHDGRRSHLRLTRAGARLDAPSAQGTVERAVRRTLARSSPGQQRAAVAVLEQFSRELMKL